MATLRRWRVAGLMLLVWVSLFAFSYTQSASREEEQLLRLHRLLSSAQSKEAYFLSEQVVVDGRMESSVQTHAQSSPRLAKVSLRSRLTDTEDFRLQVYFHPEAVYLYSENSGIWNKAAYNHPSVGELEGLRDPFAFWLRMLGEAESIEQTKEGMYSLTLQPFRDDIHGIHVDDVIRAHMQVQLDEQTGKVKSLKLDAELKPSIIKSRERLSYRITLLEEHEEPELTLPKEAMTAEPMP
ncbi:hypothetical protein NDK47_09225 [Brevibacillus ruminantium]|uniref:Outer membrane lipoprotein carrier protein LolA n=1 Tax=Brevibacillus ruminantium TaxID=2950604 RepID=A0ABY4WNL9_9BACL|nr:hypothetical protein [Brevibacillus ruminantium]USG67435.1 hypothetical protein NDK47_09225 [Brevibacillus ruminantium]